MTDDLVAWLTAQLDADEAAALLCPPWPWRLNAEHDTVLADDDIEVAEVFALSNNQLRNTAAHIALHNPARVLRGIAAKRALITEWQDRSKNLGAYPTMDVGIADGLELAIRHLAAVYAGRDGWKEEWAPDA